MDAVSAKLLDFVKPQMRVLGELFRLLGLILPQSFQQCRDRLEGYHLEGFCFSGTDFVGWNNFLLEGSVSAIFAKPFASLRSVYEPL